MDAKGIETEREVDGRWIAEDKSRPGMMAYGATKIEAVLTVDKMRLRAEVESLKADAVNWDEWRERVAAEFFQSDRFGMNDIWIAIAALILQRDEAQRLHQKQFDDSMIAHRFFERFVGEIARGKDFSVKVQLADGVIAARDARSERAEKQRDEARSECALVEKERDAAMQSFRTAIELEGPQKYAKLLDERDVLVVRLEAAEKENKRLEGKAVACQNRIDDDTESMNKLCARVGALERQKAAMREALEAIHKCWIVTAGNPALKYALELVSGALTIAPVPESQYAESIADPKLAAWYQQIANFANHMAWLTDQSEAAEKSGIDGRDVQVNISAQFYAVRTGTEWHMRFTLADLRRALSVFNRE